MERQEYFQVQPAFTAIGLDDAEQLDVWHILSAVLLCGNVDFEVSELRFN